MDQPIRPHAMERAGNYQQRRGHQPRRWENGAVGGERVRAQNQHYIQYLKRDDLEMLARSTPENVVRYVNENEPGFLAAYSHAKFCTHPLLLKHLVKILYHLVNSDSPDLTARVLARIFSSSGDYSQFLFQLSMLIQTMSTEARPHIRRENPQYLYYLVEIGLFAISRIPMSVRYTFPVDIIKATVDQLSSMGEQVSVLATRVELLAAEFASTKEELQHHSARPKVCDDTDEPFPEPPEHFTTLSVLPTNEEVEKYAEQPYLRPNVTSGGYQNWDHYLDVQFRLLREDFIAPLRDGITQHCEGKKSADVYVYKGVSIMQPVCLYSGIGFTIRFNTINLKRVNWEHSKRLIFGSLLCLTRDDFETVIFATVAKRDPKLLQEGLLTIKFEDETNGFQIDPNHHYTMVESSAYFEAYRHVLEGLQKASTAQLTDMMPFKRYIVDCQLQGVPMPPYLRSLGQPVFNLREILETRPGLSNILLTDPSRWPSPDQTCLDPSQFEAFMTALTHEITVIQGPPGTGKTFIGYKIVEALLRNRYVWDSKRTSPILVVCYTNHALDQFLGVVKWLNIEGHEPNIVRIGGRCKTENLKSCVLREKVQSIRSQRALPRSVQRPFAKARGELFKLKDEISRFQKNLETSEGKILSLTTLQSVINPDHHFQLQNGMPTEPGKEMEVWLGLWFPQESASQVLAGPGPGVFIPLEDPLSSDNLVDQRLEDTPPDDDLIEVDAEARLLEEDRILEGEEVELESNVPASQSSIDDKVRNSKFTTNKSGWRTVQLSNERRKKLIREGQCHRAMSKRSSDNVHDVWALNIKDRWKLYKYWVNEFTFKQKNLLSQIGQTYNEACAVYRECQNEIDNYVTRGADVIGITTTGAAKHHHLLKSIHPKIVIVEEAAEVFEAHVVGSLSPSVQQLILIGDHKQLRPKPNSYNLEKKYGLAMSFFERLAENGLKYITLTVQHRMRPEIAGLVRPSIYDRLDDHSSVKQCENIRGIGKNIFAISHNYPEESNDANDMRSYSNLFEAEYLVELCKYLLKQGYEPTQITVLTMYRGQLLELRRRMKRADFQGVRVAAVDDFQGEENDIILLSLVRSNSQEKIGFLKVSNRVCVSLSRAKVGFYIIGNFSMLQYKFDTVWANILTYVEKQHCIGSALPLHCHNHPNQKVMAKTPQDFLKCPEGGCQQPCATRLKCGHTCPRMCHPYDQEHKKFKCKKLCGKQLSCGHRCRFQCFTCTDGCQPCTQKVERMIPKCGHKVPMPCSSDPTKMECTVLCGKILPCSHMCQEPCSKPCTKVCTVKVTKTLPCNHYIKDACFKNPDTIKCQEPCNTFLDCGHKCAGTCGQCYRGRLHIRCQSQCGRTLVCGHTCEFPCTPNCPPCLKKCNNYCVHSKCPKRCYELCDPCMEPCEWKCEHFQCSRPCGEMCNRPPCDKPCKKRLPCGHRCIGLCGEKCPKKCRICNKDEVCTIFFGPEDEPDAKFIELQDCGHIVEVTSLDAWMDITPDDDSSKEVQFKVCPICKTEIRKSLRYGNVIKQTLEDHESIKKIQLKACQVDLKAQFQVVQTKLSQSSNGAVIAKELEVVREAIYQKRPLFPHHVNALQTQLSLLGYVVEISECLNAVEKVRISCRFSTCKIDVQNIRYNVHTVLQFFMQELPSQQQISDAQCELRRLSCVVKLCDLSCKLVTSDQKLNALDDIKFNRMVKNAYESGLKTKMSESIETEVYDFIAAISKHYRVSGITESERIEIVKAIGLSKGHWYKCPNGHFYCIGECGGAMETAKCPDCGAKVGGGSHRLAEGNAHAPEMDNSQYAAWSEGANLANFDLDELQRLFH